MILPKRSWIGEKIPIEIYDEARKQARRSTLRAFRTGAVIFDNKSGEVVGKGCSYHRAGMNLSSVHAEHAALEYARYSVSGIRNIFVLSIGRVGNPAYSSCPCLDCSIKLAEADIYNIYYLERYNNGTWTMRSEKPSELLDRAMLSGIRVNQFARNMRLK